jgi:hypothetical protein
VPSGDADAAGGVVDGEHDAAGGEEEVSEEED